MLTKMKEKLGQDLKKQLDDAQKKLEDEQNDKNQLLEVGQDLKQKVDETKNTI